MLLATTCCFYAFGCIFGVKRTTRQWEIKKVAAIVGVMCSIGSGTRHQHINSLYVTLWWEFFNIVVSRFYRSFFGFILVVNYREQYQLRHNSGIKRTHLGVCVDWYWWIEHLIDTFLSPEMDFCWAPTLRSL